MKYSEARTEKTKQFIYKIQYEIQKRKDWFKRFAWKKEKRKTYKDKFRAIYLQDYEPTVEIDNSLPRNLYLLPLAIFTSDIMPANEIQQIRKGLIQLIHKQKCDKFLGTNIDLDRIENIHIYEPGANFWSNLGLIDFDNNVTLRDKISYIQIKLRNLNASYLMLDLEIVLADKEIKLIDRWMREERQQEIIKYAKQFRSKKGRNLESKYWVGKVYYDGTIERLNFIEKEYVTIKKLIFNEIAKYLPLQLHERDIIQPSCVLYKSNLNQSKNIPGDFLWSMGLNPGIIKTERYISKEISCFMYSIEQSKGANQYVIYMDQDIKKESGYYSKEFQMIDHFDHIYTAIAREELAKYLYNDFKNTCIAYRSKFKNISLSRRSLKRLYKLRSQYYREMSFFRSATSIEKAWFSYEKGMDSLRIIAFNKFVSVREWVSFNRNKEMTEFSLVIDKEIEDKILLCKDLSDRHQNMVSSFVAILSLMISFAALLVALKIDLRHVVELLIHN